MEWKEWERKEWESYLNWWNIKLPSITNPAPEMIAKRCKQRQGVIWEYCLALPRGNHALSAHECLTRRKQVSHLQQHVLILVLLLRGLCCHYTAQEIGQTGAGTSLSSFTGLTYRYCGFHLFSLLSWQASGWGRLYFLTLPSSLGTSGVLGS